MEYIFYYLVNVFLNSTKRSYFKALTLSQFHDAALLGASSDAYFAGLSAVYHPLHHDYVTKYSIWKMKFTTAKSKTNILYQLIKELSSTKIDNWDIAVQNIYNHKTTQYKALFSNGRKPFQTGKITNRIGAIKNLSDMMDGDAALATIKADVDAFWILIKDAAKEQKTAISERNVAKNNLEDARILICEEMYANLGSLISKYKKTPEKAGDYFDLNTLRITAQTHYTKLIKSLKIYKICKHTFKEGDKINIYNNGLTDLIFYIAQHKEDKPTETSFTIASGEEKEIPVSLLGDITNKLLMAYNPDENETGEFELDIL